MRSFMVLDNIPAGTAISIEAFTENKNLELQSTSLSISDEFNKVCANLAHTMGFHYFLVISPIFQDQTVINFDNFMLNYNLNVVLNDQLFTWKNVTIKYIPMSKGKFVHIIFSNQVAIRNNRRKTFRLWLGYDITCTYDGIDNTEAAVLKDLSIGGMGVILKSGSPIQPGSKIKINFQEEIETTPGTRPTYRQYILKGQVLRVTHMENGQLLVGCQFPAFYQPVSTFIADKQRQRARLHAQKAYDHQLEIERERMKMETIKRHSRERKRTKII